MDELRRRYSIIHEPRRLVYRQLLEFLLGRCNQAILVARGQSSAGPELVKLMMSLHPWLVSEADEAEWPGTRLIGHTARVYRYTFDNEMCKVLCASADGLYDWRFPGRPEDLCILQDEVPFLTTVTHEREGYLDLTSPEHDELSRANAGLLLYRGEIMPAAAEPYRLFGAFLDEDSLEGQSSIDAAMTRYISIASPESVDEVLVAIRQVVFGLKDDAVLRVVLERWGAAPRLLASSSPTRTLTMVADKLEQALRRGT